MNTRFTALRVNTRFTALNSNQRSKRRPGSLYSIIFMILLLLLLREKNLEKKSPEIKFSSKTGRHSSHWNVKKCVSFYFRNSVRSNGKMLGHETLLSAMVFRAPAARRSWMAWFAREQTSPSVNCGPQGSSRLRARQEPRCWSSPPLS